jgi:hypothetical protein
MHTCHMPLAVLSMLVIAACESGAPTSPSSSASSGLAGEPGRQVNVATPTAGMRQQPATGPSAHPHVNVEFTPDMRQQIGALHPLFARYHDLDKAIADGYGFVGPCVSDPALGGMGDHYSLNAEIDFGRGDGTYALETPQYLVYAPQKNGGRRLAALDYAVPYEKWHSAEPPAFFGIPFTRNDGFGVWMFHIWLFEHNPAGMFANFNPTVPQC